MNTWEGQADIPWMGVGKTCSALQNEVYVIGGDTNTEPSDNVYVFNLDTNQWRMGETLMIKALSHSNHFT